MNRLRLAAAAAALLLAAPSAGAQVLLSDNFNGLNGGSSALNYAAFPNWTVTGVVDLVSSGDFGITCVGGTGSCVDLDGSRSTAGSLMSNVFFFSPGETFTVSFDLSGNQRGGGADVFFAALHFGVATSVINLNASGHLGAIGYTGLVAGTFTANSLGIAPGSPWTAGSLYFTAVNAGQVQVQLGTYSADNVGPVLDNVVISKSVPTNVVPEPSTYALMGAGLLALGVAARRRRV